MIKPRFPGLSRGETEEIAAQINPRLDRRFEGVDDERDVIVPHLSHCSDCFECYIGSARLLDAIEEEAASALSAVDGNRVVEPSLIRGVESLKVAKAITAACLALSTLALGGVHPQIRRSRSVRSPKNLSMSSRQEAFLLLLPSLKACLNELAKDPVSAHGLRIRQAAGQVFA